MNNLAYSQASGTIAAANTVLLFPGAMLDGRQVAVITFSSTIAVSDGEQLTLDSVTYTFRSSLPVSTSPNTILIGATPAATIQALRHAINGSGMDRGVTFDASTLRNPTIASHWFSPDGLSFSIQSRAELTSAYTLTSTSQAIQFQLFTNLSSEVWLGSGRITRIQGGCKSANGVFVTVYDAIVKNSGRALVSGAATRLNQHKVDFPGVSATGTLTTTGWADGETAVIAGVTYTAKNTLTAAAGNFKRTGTLATDLVTFQKAVNGTGVPGTDYSVATTPNPAASITSTTATTAVATARVPGVAGNAVTTTETQALGAWGGATLSGGVDSTVNALRGGTQPLFEAYIAGASNVGIATPSFLSTLQPVWGPRRISSADGATATGRDQTFECDIPCENGMIVAITLDGANTLTPSATDPLSLTVTYEPWSLGSARKRLAAKNAAMVGVLV